MSTAAVASTAASGRVPSRFAQAAGGSGRPARVHESSSNKTTALQRPVMASLRSLTTAAPRPRETAVPEPAAGSALAELHGASRFQPLASLPIW